MGQLKYHNGTAWVYLDLPDQNNSSLLVDVALTGLINGTNKVFTSPIPFSTISVYRNGLRMRSGATNDYTVTGPSEITFNTAPAVTSPATTITADISSRSSVNTSGSNSFVYHEVPSGLKNGSNTAFTTAKGYIANSLQVFRNGIRDKDITEVSPSAGTFTTDLAPNANDHWEVAYQFSYGTSGNADTVDGFNASSTPIANTISPLDVNARALWDIMPVGTQRQIGYAARENGTLEAIYAQNAVSMIRNDANTANLTANFTNSLTTVYVSVEVVCWGVQGYKNIRLLLDGSIPATMVPSSSPVSYLTDQVTAAAITFRLTGVTLGAHNITAALFRPNESGIISYRNAAIRVYEVKE